MTQDERDSFRDIIRDAYLEKMRSGMRHLQAVRAVREELRASYGAGPSWALILEIFLELLPLLLQLFSKKEAEGE